jgi:protein-S-isoprenylcysteine O-methyltransferase Ste14
MPQEIRTDKDIDRLLACVFLGFVLFSIYGILNGNGELVSVEVAASIPLNLMAAVSFWTREPAREQARTNEILVPAVSVVIPFLAMNSPLVCEAPYSLPSGLIFAVSGAALSVASFSYLRRSFAIFPSVRRVVVGGPYRAVRHPLYLGELIYATGMIMLAFSMLSLILMALSIAFLVWRIEIEERKLSIYPEYERYAKMVRFRLIPFVY